MINPKPKSGEESNEVERQGLHSQISSASGLFVTAAPNVDSLVPVEFGSWHLMSLCKVL